MPCTVPSCTHGVVDPLHATCLCHYSCKSQLEIKSRLACHGAPSSALHRCPPPATSGPPQENGGQPASWPRSEGVASKCRGISHEIVFHFQTHDQAANQPQAIQRWSRRRESTDGTSGSRTLRLLPPAPPACIVPPVVADLPSQKSLSDIPAAAVHSRVALPAPPRMATRAASPPRPSNRQLPLSPSPCPTLGQSCRRRNSSIVDQSQLPWSVPSSLLSYLRSSIQCVDRQIHVRLNVTSHSTQIRLEQLWR